MYKHFIYTFFIVIFSCCIVACSEKAIAPETEVKQFIETAKLAAENRSHSQFSELIHDAYQDHNGMDKKRLIKTLRAYFFTHKDIYLYTKIDSINFQGDNSAFVVLNIAMAGKVIANIDSLNSLRAKIYRFELLLTKENKWLLKQTKWQPTTLKAFF